MQLFKREQKNEFVFSDPPLAEEIIFAVIPEFRTRDIFRIPQSNGLANHVTIHTGLVAFISILEDELGTLENVAPAEFSCPQIFINRVISAKFGTSEIGQAFFCSFRR